MVPARVVGITRAPSVLEDGGAVLKARCADERQALQQAERKVRTYGKALFALASLLCLSVCGNLASSALTILVFKESRIRGAIPPVVPSASKAAAPVGTILTSEHGLWCLGCRLGRRRRCHRGCPTAVDAVAAVAVVEVVAGQGYW